MSDLVKRLRIKAGMIEMGEMIAWGSDSALMREAADALEMAAPAEWNGTGVPPVGSICEAKVTQRVHAMPGILGYAWRKVEVCKTGGPDAPSECLVFDLKTTIPSWADEFRPIRTPEQIAAEKREREINELVEVIVTHYEYPKGAESYIGLARALHDAGYRKTEQEKNND